MKILLHNARILKMDDTPLLDGDIVITDSYITYIGLDSDQYGPFDIVHDCQRNVLMPGFKNAHSHSGMVFVRSKTDGYNLHDWLFDVVFPREDCLKPNDVYELSKIAFLEYLTSGITACFDQYFFPPMIAKAAHEMGMRVLLLATTNANTSEEELLETFHEFNDPKDDLVRYCLGIHAEYTTKEDEFDNINRLIHKTKSPFYTHVSETKEEVEGCYQRRGMSPVQFFISQGFYDYGGGAYHCIYFDDQDINSFKEHHLNIVACPGSNAKLADGVIDIEKYRHAGINIALGTDGPASNNALNMFKEMSMAYSLAKITNHDVTALPAYEVLKMATVNGSKAMGLDNADILEVGKKADIIEIDLSRPNMQPLNDIVSNIVYSGSKDNIKMTMINGKILYLNGAFHIEEDIRDIYQKCQKITARIEKDLANKKLAK